MKPPPTRRLRRAYLHLPYSMTISRLLDTTSRRTERETLASLGSHQVNVPVIPILSILNGLSVARIEVLLFPVASVVRLPDPIPLLQPHYKAFIAPTDRSVPVLRIGTLASRFWPLGLLPLTSERLVPAVPRNSLHPFHAPSTPVAIRPVIRHLADLSQVGYTLLVSTTLVS